MGAETNNTVTDVTKEKESIARHVETCKKTLVSFTQME